MADATTVDKYPKASYNKAQVDHIRQGNIDAGAKSCTETEDATNYILTTVWPGATLLALLKYPGHKLLAKTQQFETLEKHPKAGNSPAALRATLLEQGASSCDVAEFGEEINASCLWTRSALISVLEAKSNPGT